SDKEAVSRAFSGAEAAYVMIPPDLANPNYPAYQDKVIEAVASCLLSYRMFRLNGLIYLGQKSAVKSN
ncbi:MAG: hypothetical protein ACR2JB_00530, partial [Bryobacteraceae bacterium]